MLECFYPDVYLDSAYDIDYKDMFEKGYRGIIFDIDNTLVKDNAPADERSCELIKRLETMGFKCMVVSNNKEHRGKSFCDVVKLDYVFKAHKPGTDGFFTAMKRMETDLTDTFFVGDQLFTDVWGAKRTGIHNILVRPINPKEEIQIVLKRYLEKIVLHFYKKRLKNERN